MLRHTSLLLFLLLNVALLYSSLDYPYFYYDYSAISVMKTIEIANSSISYLQDRTGNQYLVKQKSNVSPRKLILCALKDVIAADICECLKIPANKVWIIPQNKLFPGKTNKQMPATLHTLVPGAPLKDCNSHYSTLMIKQIWCKKSKRTEGLTLEVIKNMALHKDLPPIVALDTFIGNNDRKNANIFYDAKTDSFFAIDMDKSFRVNLAEHACDRFREMINEKCQLSKSEYDAIIVYQKTLKDIMYHFPAELLYEKINYYGSILKLYQSDQDYISRIITREFERIHDLIASVEKLIMYIDVFLRISRSNLIKEESYAKS